MTRKKPKGIPIETLILDDQIPKANYRGGTGVVVHLKSGFKRNYDIEFRAALDETLHRNAVKGINHGAGQSDKQAKSVEAKKGAGGKNMEQLIAAFVRPRDAETPLEIWNSFRDELREWSGGEVFDGNRKGQRTYRYTKFKSGRPAELTYKRFGQLRSKASKARRRP